MSKDMTQSAAKNDARGVNMDYSIPLRNKNPRSPVITIVIIGLVLCFCLWFSTRRKRIRHSRMESVEIEILCHSEFSTDLTYDNPFWERAVDGGYETFGGKLPIHFFLVVKNHNSQLPLCIYRPQYSFGYYDLHFEYLCNGIVKPIVRHDGIRWMKNVPEKSVVEPGSQLAMPVCLDSTLWRNVPEIGLSNWSEVSDGRCMIRAIMTNGVWKVGSRYEWATPHVLTSQWTTVSLISPERDIEWEH